jgi:hypothetical protein
MNATQLETKTRHLENADGWRCYVAFIQRDEAATFMEVPVLGRDGETLYVENPRGEVMEIPPRAGTPGFRVVSSDIRRRWIRLAPGENLDEEKKRAVVLSLRIDSEEYCRATGVWEPLREEIRPHLETHPGLREQINRVMKNCGLDGAIKFCLRFLGEFEASFGG